MKEETDFWANGLPVSMGRTATVGRLDHWSGGAPFRVIIPLLEFGERTQTVSSALGLGCAYSTQALTTASSTNALTMGD